MTSPENTGLNCEEGVCRPDGNKAADGHELNHSVQKAKIMYFGDPMCSWCWGITHHLDWVKETFSDQLDFELVLGGLRPGGGDEWTPEFREMLRSHWEHVEQASGQPFDYSFFERKSFEYDTEPAARAVRVVRDMDPSLEWRFYKELQKSFYALNMDITDQRVLESVVGNLGFGVEQFRSLFQSQGYRQLTYQDFAKAQMLGVRGFPTVLLQIASAYHPVALGYATKHQMQSKLEQLLIDVKV